MFLYPAVTFAAWWNPLTWKIFARQEVPYNLEVQNVEVAKKSSEEKINELQKQVDELRKQNSSSTATTTVLKIKSVDKNITVGEVIKNKATNNSIDKITKDISYRKEAIISSKGLLGATESFGLELEKIIRELDSGLSIMENGKKLQTNRPFTEGMSKEFYEMDYLITSVYDLDIKVTNSLKLKLLSFKDHSKTYNDNSMAYSDSDKYLSLSDAAKHIDSNNKSLENLKLLRVSVDNLLANYKMTSDQNVKSLNMGLRGLISYLESGIPSPSSASVDREYVPTFNIVRPVAPRYTTCNYVDFLKQINCTSY